MSDLPKSETGCDTTTQVFFPGKIVRTIQGCSFTVPKLGSSIH